MRDLFFVGFLGLFFALGLRRPFLLVLVYVYIDIVSPQRVSYFLLNSIPISAIAFVLAVLAWLLMDEKRGIRVSIRQVLMVTLLGYCGYRSEEHTSELQSLVRISYAVFCLKKQKNKKKYKNYT